MIYSVIFEDYSCNLLDNVVQDLILLYGEGLEVLRKEWSKQVFSCFFPPDKLECFLYLVD